MCIIKMWWWRIVKNFKNNKLLYHKFTVRKSMLKPTHHLAHMNPQQRLTVVSKHIVTFSFHAQPDTVAFSLSARLIISPCSECSLPPTHSGWVDELISNLKLLLMKWLSYKTSILTQNDLVIQKTITTTCINTIITRSILSFCSQVVTACLYIQATWQGWTPALGSDIVCLSPEVKQAFS